MIKSNTHKVIEKIKLYISELYMGDETDFDEICADIYETFIVEKVQDDNRYNANRIPLLALFIEWCQGLPSIIDTSEYYCRKNCIGIIQEWFEETDKEANMYTEMQAEDLITKLIYREVCKGKERSYVKNANRYMRN